MTWAIIIHTSDSVQEHVQGLQGTTQNSPLSYLSSCLSKVKDPLMCLWEPMLRSTQPKQKPWSNSSNVHWRGGILLRAEGCWLPDCIRGALHTGWSLFPSPGLPYDFSFSVDFDSSPFNKKMETNERKGFPSPHLYIHKATRTRIHGLWPPCCWQGWSVRVWYQGSLITECLLWPAPRWKPVSFLLRGSPPAPQKCNAHEKLPNSS